MLSGVVSDVSGKLQPASRVGILGDSGPPRRRPARHLDLGPTARAQKYPGSRLPGRAATLATGRVAARVCPGAESRRTVVGEHQGPRVGEPLLRRSRRCRLGIAARDPSRAPFPHTRLGILAILWPFFLIELSLYYTRLIRLDGSVGRSSLRRKDRSPRPAHRQVGGLWPHPFWPRHLSRAVVRKAGQHATDVTLPPHEETGESSRRVPRQIAGNVCPDCFDDTTIVWRTVTEDLPPLIQLPRSLVST